MSSSKLINSNLRVRQVPPTRNTQGQQHRISGTIIEVLGELDVAGIRRQDICYYSDDGTDAVCVYRRGN